MHSPLPSVLVFKLQIALNVILSDDIVTEFLLDSLQNSSSLKA
jgi:hypothetical protein